MKILGRRDNKPMGRLLRWVLATLVLLLSLAGATMVIAVEKPLGDTTEHGNYDPWADDPWADAVLGEELADPLEPLNRFFFTINDRLYFYALKPMATGYAKTVPADIRYCIRSFFRNLLAPVRVANHLLQGQLVAGGGELVRFAVNTTIGIGGLVDSAARNFGLEGSDADFGQTLELYGFGAGPYLHWPVLGPSTLRETAGLMGDGYLNPFSRLLLADSRVGVAAHGLRTVNTVSLHLGEYERLVDSAFDPYLAVRDAYWQYRSNQLGGPRRDSVVPAMFSEAPRPKINETVVDSPDFEPRVEEGPAAPAMGQELNVAPRLPADCPADHYFVHAGAFQDYYELRQHLRTLGEEAPGACLVIHQRDGYQFYGLMIPAGDQFEIAKEREQQLAGRGLTGWLVPAFAGR